MEILLGIGSRVRSPEFGVGIVINCKSNGYLISYVNHGVLSAPYYEELEIIEAVEADHDKVSLLDVERVLSNVLQKWAEVGELVPLGQKWTGGTLLLKPGTDGLQSKEMPIETFFHKIVMLRDRLRVLEQRVNASNLEDEEKVNIQQYISRCYGSLTSFNLLFKDKKDHFAS